MSEISAVIITYNEEDYIGNCIASLKDVADEIIVVDSFSTDNTELICHEHGVKFIKHEFAGYIEQKNWALTVVKYDLIVSLDADEALSKELKRSILEIKQNAEFDGYLCNRRNNYCGKWLKHSEWYPDRQLRLFKKGKGKWCGIEPHDKFRMNEGCRIGKLKGDLLHWNSVTFLEHEQKLERLSTLGAQSYLKLGRRSDSFTVYLHTSWCFLRSYLISGGFLDGYHGYKISLINARGCYQKYSKLRTLIRQIRSTEKISDEWK